MAEVSDKMPAQSTMWFFALILGALGFLVSRKIKWGIALGLITSLVMVVWAYSELNDPFVGKAIIDEQGISYALSAYCSSLLVLVATVAGFRIRANNDN